MSEKREATTYTFQSAVRVSFANIVKPRAYQGKGEERYGASFLVEPDSKDLAALKELVIAELKAQNPGKKIKLGRLTEEQEAAGDFVECNVPWKDGTKLADAQKAKGKDYEVARGKIVIKASSKFPPALSSVAGGKFTDYNDADTRPSLEKVFYSGAYVAPHVALNAYKPSNDKPGGVGLWLNAVCFVKDGPRLAGKGINAAEVFRHHVGQASNVDPGSNEEVIEDDEVPF